MLLTYEAELDEHGVIRLDELLRFPKGKRVVVTVLDEPLPTTATATATIPEIIPERFRPHLSSLPTLDDAKLWSITKRDLNDEDANRYDYLLQRNTAALITPTEQTELAQLREKADLLMFGRSYALLLLKQRGHDIQDI